MTTCPRCGTPIPTPTGRQARRRYCSDTCRKAAWRHRRRLEDQRIVPRDDPGTVTATHSAGPDPAGRHRCPHCHQPLAVITVIVPAAAANITPPEAPMNPT